MGYCTNLISAPPPPPPPPPPPVVEPWNSPGVSYSSNAGGGGDIKGNSPIYIIIIYLMVDVGKSLKKEGASQVN